MSDALIAIGSGLVLAAFIIGPMAAETSGGRRKERLTWEVWRRDAAVTLWAMNPLTIIDDLLRGYDDVADTVVRLMAWLVAAAAMLTSIALIGWGVWRLFTL